MLFRIQMLYFNSTVVQLEVTFPVLVFDLLRFFNSTVVQLEAC